MNPKILIFLVGFLLQISTLSAVVINNIDQLDNEASFHFAIMSDNKQAGPDMNGDDNNKRVARCVSWIEDNGAEFVFGLGDVVGDRWSGGKFRSWMQSNSFFDNHFYPSVGDGENQEYGSGEGDWGQGAKMFAELNNFWGRPGIEAAPEEFGIMSGKGLGSYKSPSYYKLFSNVKGSGVNVHYIALNFSDSGGYGVSRFATETKNFMMRKLTELAAIRTSDDIIIMVGHSAGNFFPEVLGKDINMTELRFIFDTCDFVGDASNHNFRIRPSNTEETNWLTDYGVINDPNSAVWFNSGQVINDGYVEFHVFENPTRATIQYISTRESNRKLVTGVNRGVSSDKNWGKSHRRPLVKQAGGPKSWVDWNNFSIGPVPNDADFISQSINPHMNPGETQQVSITMKNVGENTWSSGSGYKLGAQSPQDNRTWTSTGRVSLPHTVSKGQQVTFTFNITAPSNPGTYDFQWRMIKEGSEWFGEKTQNVAVASGVVSLSVTVSDDTEQLVSNGNVAGSSDLEFLYDSAHMNNAGQTNGDQVIGLRFSGVQLPRGVNVSNAYIQFTGDASDAGSSASITLNISGHDTDNSGGFSEGNTYDVSNRTKTSASVNWNPPAWGNGASGSAERTADISSVIQEIINRPGWSSGNSLSLIITGTQGLGSSARRAESKEGVSGKAAVLHIQYGIGDGSGGGTGGGDPVATQTFVSKGSTWKYLDNGSNQGTSWRSNSYNDSSWFSGAAPLGYSNGVVTTVGYGSDSTNKHITTYFRKSFNVSSASGFTDLTLRLARDDGAVVYLNGTEIRRDSMPTGTINYDTRATTRASGDDETRFFESIVSSSYLQEGTNVIAVELHQDTPSSSDISFDLELIGNGSGGGGTGSDPNTSTSKYRLSLRDNGATSMVIGWSDDDADVAYGTADFGTNYNSYPNKITASQTVDKYEKGMNHHFARLSGLTPDTVYYFVIKSGLHHSPRMSFKTLPSGSGFTMVSGGDSRTNRDVRQDGNRLVAKLRPQAVIFCGDYTNTNSDSEWINWLNDWQLTRSADGRMQPIIPVLGNHESYDVGTITGIFDAEAGYFSVELGDMYVASLISDGDVETQANWLKSELINNMDKRWRVTSYHKPMAVHTNAKGDWSPHYNAWAQLHYDYQVQLSVDGDSHVSKTTYPVRPDAGGEDGFVRDDEFGTVFTGEGCWGAPLRPYDNAKSWTRKGGAFNQFKWIHVENSKLTLRTVKFENVNNVGTVSDNNPYGAPSGLILHGDDVEITGGQAQSSSDPVVNFNTPSSDITINEGESLRITVDANDSDGISRVYMYKDGVEFGRSEGGAPYEWGAVDQNQNDPEITNMQAGVYLLTARAVDTLGNAGEDNITVTVLSPNADPVGPAGYIYCADENGSFSLPGVSDVAYGANGQFNYLRNQSGTINFNNSTFGDPSPGVFKHGFYKLLPLPSGPTITFISPSDGSSFNQGDSLYVNVDVQDPDGFGRVYLSIDGVQLARSEGAAPFEWGASGQNDPEISNLKPGSYQLTARSRDNLGNLSEKSITVVVEADAVTPPADLPQVSFINLTDGITVNAGDNLYVNVSAQDSDGISRVRLYKDGVQLGRSEGIAPYEWGASGQNDPEIQNLESGSFILTARATDKNGNVGEASITVNIAGNSSNPIVTFVTPTNNSTVGVGSNLYVHVDVQDSDGLSGRIYLYKDGVELNRSEGGAPYEWGAVDQNQNDTELQNLQSGTFLLTARATDTLGNIGEASITVTVSGSSSVGGVNDAQYLMMDVPATVKPGQNFDVVVTYINIGSSVWSAASQQRLGSQAPRDNKIWGTNRTHLAAPVAPGELYSFIVPSTAPIAEGSYDIQFRMVQEGVEWFGEYTEKQVIVVAP